jgi:hypothetical protein
VWPFVDVPFLVGGEEEEEEEDQQAGILETLAAYMYRAYFIVLESPFYPYIHGNFDGKIE